MRFPGARQTIVDKGIGTPGLGCAGSWAPTRGLNLKGLMTMMMMMMVMVMVVVVVMMMMMATTTTMMMMMMLLY